MSAFSAVAEHIGVQRHAAAPRSSTYIIARKTAVFEMRVQNFFANPQKSCSQAAILPRATRVISFFFFLFFLFFFDFCFIFLFFEEKEKGGLGGKEKERDGSAGRSTPCYASQRREMLLRVTLCSSVTQLPERGQRDAAHACFLISGLSYSLNATKKRG